MLLTKTIAWDDAELKFEGDSATFDGYASTFDSVDAQKDTIAKGAFAETLKVHGRPKLFFNHKWDMPIGKFPLVQEDGKGLRVRGEFTPGLTLASDVRAAAKHGTLDGMSIGGFVRKGDYTERSEGGRLITKWSRLVDISLLCFPSDGGARVELGTVKGEDMMEGLEEIETVRDFERFLRDAGGLSKGLTAAIVGRAKVVFAVDPREAAEAKGFDEVMTVLRRMGAL